MPPHNPLPPSLLLSLILLPPTILLLCNIALITTLLSSLVLLSRVLRVYLDVGIAILIERWSSSSRSTAHAREEGKEVVGLDWSCGRRLPEVEEEGIVVAPVGRVNYATLIRPLEPVSGS